MLFVVKQVGLLMDMTRQLLTLHMGIPGHTVFGSEMEILEEALLE